MGQETMQAEITAYLIEKLTELLEEAGAVSVEFTSTTLLTEIGIDSIQFINMIVQLEQKYQVLFEDHELKLSRFQTVQEIAALLMEKLEPVR